MRKMKGFVSEESCADPSIRFNHETLMEDYLELEKGIEVRRRNLQMMKQIRSTLMAEVRFLSRRYKDLTRDQAHGSPSEMMKLPNPGDCRVSSKVNTKRKKQTGLRLPVPGFELNQNSTVYNGKKEVANSSGDLSKKQKRNKGNNGNEVPRTPMSLPDLNQTERTCNEEGMISSSNKVPVFDLNEISREEEESHCRGEQQTAAEDMKSTVLSIGNNEMQGEIQLSICRTVKKGLNRAAKRKVSWQDPVALSV